MLESRAAYGWYGERGGASGESKPKEHASGWSFHDFYFEVSGTYQQTQGFKIWEIRASSYTNALKQMKKYQKQYGFTLVGDKEGCEMQRRFGEE